MSRRAEKIHEARAGHPDLTTIEVIEERLREKRSLLTTGLALVAGISVACHFLEPFYHETAERMGYRALIPAVVPANERLPAVAIDFKDRFRRADQTTDCAKLNTLLTAVKALGPRAIAVDYDFGRRPDGKANKGSEVISARTNHDSHLFLASLAAGLPTDYWLRQGDPDQAVHPYLPSDEEMGQVEMLGGLTVGNAPPMPGMMERLAEYVPKREPILPLRMLTTDEIKTHEDTPKGVGRVNAKRYLFNPATLDRVRHETIDASVSDPGEEARDAVQGRIVIIGSSTVPGDRHLRSDRRDEEAFGLHIHTAGVAAFRGDRLLTFLPWVRFLLDVLSGLVVVAFVQWCLSRRIHLKQETSHHRLALTAALLTATGVIAFGYLAVRAMNVLWMDFLAVAVLAAAHPIIERGVEAIKAALAPKQSVTTEESK